MTETQRTDLIPDNRELTLFCVARFLSAAGINTMVVATGWYVWTLTHSAWSLALIGLASFLPTIFLVFIAGHAADQYPRRRIVFLSAATFTLCAAALVACVAAGITTAVPVYAIMAVAGAARAFAMPAGQAMLPNLVAPADFPRAVTIVSGVFNAAIILGPALGGLLYAFGGMAAFGGATLMTLIAMLLFRAMKDAPQKSVKEPLSLKNVRAGLDFIRSRPVLMGAISLDLFAVLLGGVTALLPIFADEILHVGATGLGFLRAAPAAGAILIIAWLARHPLKEKAGRVLFAAVALFGVATIIFGLSTNLWLSLFMLFVLGAADGVSVIVRQTLTQMETPDEMRGRVAAVNSVFIGASNELGEFESGFLAALVGAVGSVLIGGFGTLTVVALWAKLFPDLYNRDRLVNEET